MNHIDMSFVLRCARKYGRSVAMEELDESTAFVQAYLQLIREIHARSKRLAIARAAGDYLEELTECVFMASALVELARMRQRTVEQDRVYRELLSRFGTL